jgi:hypothetical protein
VWVAAAASVAVIALVVWPKDGDRATPAGPGPGAHATPYEVAVLKGEAAVDGPGLDGMKLAAGQGAVRLPVGSTVRTPKGSRVVVRADDDSFSAYKRVTVEDPGRDSELRLEEVSGDTHRLYLARGRVHATIGADVRVRLFQVGTPSGLSVDLGCEYDLVVDDDGSTWLEVTTGGVAFSIDGREQVIPAGFRMHAPRDGRLGPPLNVDEDSAAFREAVNGYLDPDGLMMKAIPSPDELLADALKKAKMQDALTLFYLWLGTAPADAHGKRIFDRLIWLESLPGSSVTTEMVLARQPDALAAWRIKICGW